jgi:ABC-type molybdate transport system ATPase subunit
MSSRVRLSLIACSREIMRIKQITVKHLFGIFDHTINLNMEERITIIHGKNGFGKTSILRLVNGFFNLKYSDIRAIPFQKFTIIFDDKSFVDVVKASRIKKVMQDQRLILILLPPIKKKNRLFLLIYQTGKQSLSLSA